MSLEFDKDEIKITAFIKSTDNVFNEHNVFGVVDARASIAELMLDARIESAMKYGKLDFEEAEKLVLAELEESKREL